MGSGRTHLILDRALKVFDEHQIDQLRGDAYRSRRCDLPGAAGDDVAQEERTGGRAVGPIQQVNPM
jgi:hypothetical protein